MSEKNEFFLIFFPFHSYLWAQDFEIRLNSPDAKAVADVAWYFTKDVEETNVEKPEPDNSDPASALTAEMKEDLKPAFDTFFATKYAVTDKYREMALKRGKKDAEEWLALMEEYDAQYEERAEEKKDGIIVDPQEAVIYGFADFIAELYLKRSLRPCEAVAISGEAKDVTYVWNRLEVVRFYRDMEDYKEKQKSGFDTRSFAVDTDTLAVRLTNEVLGALVEKVEEMKH